MINGTWEKLLSLMAAHQEAILLALIGGLVILAIVCLVLRSQLASFKRRYNRLLRGRDGLDLEEVMARLHSSIDTAERKTGALTARLRVFEARASRFVGVGLVRYNAFHDTGSDLSFSLALINNAGDGAVVTSIYGREESRLYGKPVERGASRHPLSREELAALQRAKESIE